MKRVYAVVAALAAVLVLVPAAHAEVTTCEGELEGAVVDDLVVPSGATCSLSETEVLGNATIEPKAFLDGDAAIHGNVSVGSDAGLAMSDSSIGADLACTGCRVVSLSFMYGIGGDVRITAMMTDAGVFFDGVPIGGNLEVTGNSVIANPQFPGALQFIDTHVDGNLVVSDNVGNAGFFYTFVDGDLEIVRNVAGPQTPFDSVAFDVVNSFVAGSLEFSLNEGTSVVQENYVGDVLHCHGNRPPPTGGMNTASRIEGQCRALPEELED